MSLGDEGGCGHSGGDGDDCNSDLDCGDEGGRSDDCCLMLFYFNGCVVLPLR